MSHLSQRASKPAYYIVDCQIFDLFYFSGVKRKNDDGTNDDSEEEEDSEEEDEDSEEEEEDSEEKNPEPPKKLVKKASKKASKKAAEKAAEKADWNEKDLDQYCGMQFKFSKVHLVPFNADLGIAAKNFALI